jgi:D-amino-acid oxidase
VIFNCTGLGAGELFDDDELVPVSGQLVFLPPDPAVDFVTVGGGKGVLYMVPRKGEILLGGTFNRGNWSTQPDPVETDRIIEEHRKLLKFS